MQRATCCRRRGRTWWRRQRSGRCPRRSCPSPWPPGTGARSVPVQQEAGRHAHAHKPRLLQAGGWSVAVCRRLHRPLPATPISPCPSVLRCLRRPQASPPESPLLGAARRPLPPPQALRPAPRGRCARWLRWRRPLRQAWLRCWRDQLNSADVRRLLPRIATSSSFPYYAVPPRPLHLCASC